MSGYPSRRGPALSGGAYLQMASLGHAQVTAATAVGGLLILLDTADHSFCAAVGGRRLLGHNCDAGHRIPISISAPCVDPGVSSHVLASCTRPKLVAQGGGLAGKADPVARFASLPLFQLVRHDRAGTCCNCCAHVEEALLGSACGLNTSAAFGSSQCPSQDPKSAMTLHGGVLQSIYAVYFVHSPQSKRLSLREKGWRWIGGQEKQPEFVDGRGLGLDDFGGSQNGCGCFHVSKAFNKSPAQCGGQLHPVG